MRVLLTEWFRDLILNVVIGSRLLPRPLRPRLLRLCGIKVKRATILPGCFFGGRRVAIGHNTFVNYGAFFDNVAPITLGDRISLGPEVMILTGSHDLGGQEQRRGPVRSAPVFIHDGCWLGARVTVMPGVTIGAGCMIAAGAVVTKDCEPNGLYAGVPARRLRDLSAI